MPVKPKIKTLTNSSVDIFNAIRNNASVNYRNYVPVATADADSIRTIGAVLMDNPNLMNEFSTALFNRIGLVLARSAIWDNPLRMFKKGLIEMGETVEDIFVEMAKPFQFDPDYAENNVFKKEKPDIRSAFYVMNYQKYYKTTTSPDQWKAAFLSWDGVTDLLQKTIGAMTTGASYDEYNVMLYMLGRKILEGRLYPVEVPSVSASNARTIVSDIKAFSNALEFLSDKYNIAGVHIDTKKDEQYILVNAKFDAMIDTEVLASAFNMDKVTFLGHKVLVNSFGDIDNARLATLFDGDSTYNDLSTEELAALDAIPAVLVSRDFFMIFDNLITMRDLENGEGLYRNYWLHTWKTFAVSPFANAGVFVPGTPAVASVTVTPSTATMSEGTLALAATVATSNFAPETVTWTVATADKDKATVSQSGVVTLAEDLDNTTITITATSTFDSTKSASCVITVPDV